jgi:hypothetical protein
MSVVSTVREKLDGYVAKKFGRWGLPSEIDEQLGPCVYVYSDETYDLRIFEKGLSYGAGQDVHMHFSEIKHVKLLVLKELVLLKGPWATAQLRLRMMSDTEHSLGIPYSIYSSVAPLLDYIVRERI